MTHTTKASVTTLCILVIIIAAILIISKAQPKPQEQNLVPPSEPSAVTALYSCNDKKSITAQYLDEKVILTLSDGRIMTLPQAISASGARYANADESFVFWSKGNGALVLENDKERSYIGCIAIASGPKEFSQIYSNGSEGFSLRLPPDFKPGTTEKGIKFTIPDAMTTGTNLSSDTYLSVEHVANPAVCKATLFTMFKDLPTINLTDNGVEYSVATSSDAAAGNRYEETVFARTGTNPCIAIRYFIHYGNIQNYPEGTRKEFDRNTLLMLFDEIRSTLIVNQ